MMRALLYTLLPVVFLMLALGAGAMWVFIKSSVRPFFKFLLIPAVLAACIAVPTIFVTLMGYAVWLPPPAEFIVLGHNAVVMNGKKQTLEIWIKTKDSTRLYAAPYSKELEKQLEEIRKGRKKGMEGRLKRKDGTTDRHHDTDESPYQMELALPEMPGKEPLEQEEGQQMERMPNAPEPEARKPQLMT